MDQVNRAWLAGFYEGEGSLSLRSGKYPYPRLQIMQVEREPLDKCQRITKAGKVYGPYDEGKRRPTQKPYYVWSVNRKKDIWRVIDEIYALLSARRKAQVDACRR